MNIRWEISQKEAGKFVNSCEAVIRNVGNGTKTACELACAEILAASLEQVPKDTWTLASTADYRVRRRNDTKGYSYEGIVGYAGAVVSGQLGAASARFGMKEVGRTRGLAGSTLTRLRAADFAIGGDIGGHDPVNPKSGLPASAYAAIVHEDLDMPHPRGGKAKFLEDPVREYGERFKRVTETYWRWAIQWQDGVGRNQYGREVNMRMPVFHKVRLTAGQAAPHGPRGGNVL